MHVAFRGPLLFVLACSAIVGAIAIGQVIDSLSYSWVRTTEHFWLRVNAVPIFEIASAATIMSLMLPAAYFGVNVSSQLRETGAIVSDGWGEHAEITVFLLTSFVAFSLLPIFPPDNRQFPEPMSSSQYIWIFVAVWWMHGLLNVVHIWMLRRRK